RRDTAPRGRPAPSYAGRCPSPGSLASSSSPLWIRRRRASAPDGWGSHPAFGRLTSSPRSQAVQGLRVVAEDEATARGRDAAEVLLDRLLRLPPRLVSVLVVGGP